MQELFTYYSLFGVMISALVLLIFIGEDIKFAVSPFPDNRKTGKNYRNIIIWAIVIICLIPVINIIALIFSIYYLR